MCCAGIDPVLKGRPGAFYSLNAGWPQARADENPVWLLQKEPQQGHQGGMQCYACTCTIVLLGLVNTISWCLPNLLSVPSSSVIISPSVSWTCTPACQLPSMSEETAQSWSEARPCGTGEPAGWLCVRALSIPSWGCQSHFHHSGHGTKLCGQQQCQSAVPLRFAHDSYLHLECSDLQLE